MATRLNETRRRAPLFRDAFGSTLTWAALAIGATLCVAAAFLT